MPFQYKAAVTSISPKQLNGRVHTQWDFQHRISKQLTLLYESHLKKQPSVIRLEHPSPPLPGGDALQMLPSVHAHHHCCQKYSATSWTHMFQGRPSAASCVMGSKAFKIKTAKVVKRIQICEGVHFWWVLVKTFWFHVVRVL